MATNAISERQGQAVQPRGPGAGGTAQKLLPAPPSARLGQRAGQRPNLNVQRVARGLAWFSVGLGLTELLAPSVVANLVGVRGRNRALIRVLGLRELTHGALILLGRPVEGVWSRVGGDAMDFAVLSTALVTPGAERTRVLGGLATVAGTTALDVLCAQQMLRQDGQPGSAFQVRQSVTVNRSPDELYDFWHNFENLPRFMDHLKSVRVYPDGRSHWVAKAPAGLSVEWDAEVVQDVRNERIAWRSIADADVPNYGSVEFQVVRPGRGTIVRVELEYRPPAGAIGKAVARMFGEEPSQQVQGDLRRFKQVMETGEVVLSDATVRGTGAFDQRPAQPLGGQAGNGSRLH